MLKTTLQPYSIYIHVPFCRQACSYCDFYFVTRQKLIPEYISSLLEDIAQSALLYRTELCNPYKNMYDASSRHNDSIDQDLYKQHDVNLPRDANLQPDISLQRDINLQSGESLPVVHHQNADTSGENEGIVPVLKSIYFGGGTPSRLPASAIAQILNAIDIHHGLSDVREITLEANPDDLTSLQTVQDLKDAGVTRLSMGIQSFDASLLTFMNRAHTAEQAVRSLDFIQKVGFDTHTVDLIYGNPGQSLKQLETDIQTFLSFNPPHISAYALTIEPNTRLGKALKLGRLTEPDDNDVAQHMNLVSNMLGNAGLQRYEVSNFARPGHEAVHNSSYWNHTPYLGVGPGSHSLLLNYTKSGGIGSGFRWSAPADLWAYIRHFEKSVNEPSSIDSDAINNAGHTAKHEIAESISSTNKSLFREDLEQLHTTELAEERIMMGLRTIEGIGTDELSDTYNYTINEEQRAFIAKMRQEGLMVSPDLKLSADGYVMADRITLEILSRGKEE